MSVSGLALILRTLHRAASSLAIYFRLDSAKQATPVVLSNHSSHAVMSNYDWNTEKLHSVVTWYGMVDFDPSAPDSANIVQKIDPTSTQGQILVAFQNFFDSRLEPDDVVKRLRDLVLDSGEKEPTMAAWQFMIGAVTRASHFFEYDTLARLVDTVLELSKLPESLPYHPIFGEHASNVEPGDLAFSRLPGLGLLLFENLQGLCSLSCHPERRKLIIAAGPRSYICKLQDVTFQASLAAQTRFKNISAFAAMLTHIYLLGLPCRAMDFDHVALATLSHALENEIPEDSPQDHSTMNCFRMGDPAILQLPAAIQWVNVTGRELFHLSSHRDEVVSRLTKTGPLWKPRKSDRLWSKTRWEFWRQRLLYLAGRG